MGTIIYNNAIVIGNFSKLRKRRPKNRITTGYKLIVPFDFKWRHRIGKVECTCTECEEHFMPYCGTTWYHSKECALMQLLDKRPQIQNLWQYSGRDMRMIASTE